MNRRTFIALSTAAGLTPLTRLGAADTGSPQAARDFYELRQYHFDTAEQAQGFEAFLAEAAIPALNRLGVKPVGVFFPAENRDSAYVLLRHASLQGLATLTQRMLADQEFVTKGADVLNAPAEKPAYKRVESSLLKAFEGLRHLERPIESAGRVFQLRIYESPSVKTGQKKIEMFNTAEIAIFRKVGLHPVFFGEALVGTKVPNLTYMLAFDSLDQQKANWKKFGADPDWQQLRAKPEYADKKILCGITNILLKPAACSQI